MAYGVVVAVGPAASARAGGLPQNPFEDVLFIQVDLPHVHRHAQCGSRAAEPDLGHAKFPLLRKRVLLTATR